MARQGALLGLTEAIVRNVKPDTAEPQPSPTSAPPHTLSGRGAIGAISRSIEEMAMTSVQDLDPALIDPSIIADRIDETGEPPPDLLESIRVHGQQVPILVRPHPTHPGRYQIAYGRRRLAAITKLGEKIRAVVKDLTDDQLIVAQGQENSARQDLSYVEKALFAQKLELAGYSRNLISEALTTDQTGVSRLIQIATQIPTAIIKAIGPAPRTGRPRWVTFASLIANPLALEDVNALIAKPSFKTKDTDVRFGLAMSAAKDAVYTAYKSTTWKRQDGVEYARFSETNRSLTLTVNKKIVGGFSEYLKTKLPDLYESFLKQRTKSALDSSIESDKSSEDPPLQENGHHVR